MKFDLMSSFVKFMVVLFTAILLFGCSSGSSSGGDNPVVPENTVDVKGTWSGYDPDGIPFVMNIQQNGSKISGTISGSDFDGDIPIDGSIDQGSISIDVNIFPRLSFQLEKDQNQLVGTWSHDSDSGALIATKEESDVNLSLWHQSQWWLNIHIGTLDATRVYVTSNYITSEYDLFYCGVEDGLDYWWSSNNPDCTEGNNNYQLAQTPSLPFDATIHLVKPQGEISYNVTVTEYNTHDDSGENDEITLPCGIVEGEIFCCRFPAGDFYVIAACLDDPLQTASSAYIYGPYGSEDLIYNKYDTGWWSLDSNIGVSPVFPQTWTWVIECQDGSTHEIDAVVSGWEWAE